MQRTSSYSYNVCNSRHVQKAILQTCLCRIVMNKSRVPAPSDSLITVILTQISTFRRAVMFPYTVTLKTFILTYVTRSSSCIRVENGRVCNKCHQWQNHFTCYKERHVIVNIDKLTAQIFGGQMAEEQAEGHARTHTHRAIYSICLDISL